LKGWASFYDDEEEEEEEGSCLPYACFQAIVKKKEKRKNHRVLNRRLAC